MYLDINMMLELSFEFFFFLFLFYLLQLSTIEDTDVMSSVFFLGFEVLSSIV